MALLLGAVAVCSSCTTSDREMDIDGIEPVAGPYIELTFDTSMMTRVAGEKEKLLDPERDLKTVDLFFYTGGTGSEPDVNAAPVKVDRFVNTDHNTEHKVTISDSEIELIFGAGSKENGGECRVYAVVNVSDEAFKAAGITDKSAATITQLRTIKATTPSFAAKFAKPEDPTKAVEGIAMFTLAEGGDIVTYTASASGGSASGKVIVKNLAAKIDLYVNFAPNVDGVDPNDKEAGSVTWQVAMTNSGIPTSEVHILQGVKSVVLGGYDREKLVDDDYYSIRSEEEKYTRPLMSSGEGTGEGKYPWKMKEPYYSYPNSWIISPLEQYRTKLMLKVDWLPEGKTAEDADVLTTYYSVPLNLESNNLESNKYYRVKVDINSLGGMNFGEPLELSGSWEVLDWAEAPLEADLRELRYLDVSQTQTDQDGSIYTAVVNGAEGIVTIPFESSHEVAIRDVKIEYMTFDGADDSTAGSRDKEYYAPGKSFSPNLTPSEFERQTYRELMNNKWQGAYIDNVNKNITVKYPIGGPGGGTANNIKGVGGNSRVPYYYPVEDGKYMYITYKITITIKHADSDQRFDNEVITIIRHPSIYVEGEVNKSFNDTGFKGAAESGSSSDYSKDRWKYNTAMHHHGFARVNNENPRNASFGGLEGIQKANFSFDIGSWFDNSSDLPIMYIVTATRLEDAEDMRGFHIKDPRVTTNEAANLGASWTAAPHYLDGKFDNDNYTLQYYYPTNGSLADEDKYAVSPKYRIASAFGVVERKVWPLNDEIDVAEATRRCASYCEDGYPAGRWRVPTVGELKFVQMLSNRKLIPRVFNTGTDYVTAQGVYRFDKNGNDSPNGKDGYVRCVYDDWYWVNRDKDSKYHDEPDYIRNTNGEKDPYGARPTDHKIFIWGDREKNNPQIQETN